MGVLHARRNANGTIVGFDEESWESWESRLAERRERLGLEGLERDGHEVGYRHGYHDGYVVALDTLAELVRARARGRPPATFGAAYDAAVRFAYTALLDWQNQEGPPDAPLPRVTPPQHPADTHDPGGRGRTSGRAR